MPKENQRSKPRGFKDDRRPSWGSKGPRAPFPASRGGRFSDKPRTGSGRPGGSGFRSGTSSRPSGFSRNDRSRDDRPRSDARSRPSFPPRFEKRDGARSRSGFSPRFEKRRDEVGSRPSFPPRFDANSGGRFRSDSRPGFERRDEGRARPGSGVGFRKNRDESDSTQGKSTSWGRVADWYKGMVEDDKSYQQQVILPNLLKVLDLRHSEQVLDLACGEGTFSREFARLGAHVVGVDISPELIELARERDNFNVRYEVASAEELAMIPSGSIQIVTLVSAIQNMPDLNPVLSECRRVLRKGGRLVIVMNHPAFRIPKSSSWGWDSKDGVLYRRLDRYLTEARALIQMHPGDDPREVTSSFHRPLSVYFESFARNGFLVKRLEEWISNRKSEPGPRATAEDKARKEFPLFMCLEVVKTDKDE